MKGGTQDSQPDCLQDERAEEERRGREGKKGRWAWNSGLLWTGGPRVKSEKKETQRLGWKRAGAGKG